MTPAAPSPPARRAVPLCWLQQPTGHGASPATLLLTPYCMGPGPPAEHRQHLPSHPADCSWAPQGCRAPLVQLRTRSISGLGDTILDSPSTSQGSSMGNSLQHRHGAAPMQQTCPWLCALPSYTAVQQSTWGEETGRAHDPDHVRGAQPPAGIFPEWGGLVVRGSALLTFMC